MKQHGFTLIELMVVLVIIGIASAAISLSIKPDPLHLLRKDAERLSQLLQVAQAEARADGRPITWRADAKGFRFNRRSEDGMGMEAFKGDAQLRPRLWESPSMQINIEPRQTLVLDAEWINPPVRVVLSDGQHSLSLQRDAAGLMRVVSLP
ncbi:type II secretion system protein GspH [Pseudomonas sp. PB105]|uniref:type II secretion system minor pseudopilin GspH n=1 Tax=Pseudomonas TaxID=286 RepID=UPI000C153ECE|nr:MULTISPECIES: type II secretion system minor pseudopilin GspH [Pseudomonas]KAE9651228.1 type II secretion system protein GspH [Pseudomonas sp. PB105]MBD8239366.1 type II secretion system minor pseudopilin GspH [Pseudomonas fluorescens]MCM2364657.1 type II secretion system minor pseudopilin GspH [Pseudomonas sp. SR18]MDY0898370.1 type II secretion system minor pseudopilin GspH [Pseudomonas fluorescens]MVW95320.1 type II secretion system protein GspH [Pseudomonas sp. PB100]